MWSFRKEAHKVNSTGVVLPIACGEEIEFQGQRGIFLVNIQVGTATGVVALNYEAYGIPDRFQIDYDSFEKVADSLYVGSDLIGNPPDTSGMVGSTYNNIPEKFWNGTFFAPTGNTEDITVNQNDIAAFGETNRRGVISFIKETAFPTDIQVKVSAPLASTFWALSTLCPTDVPKSTLIENDLVEEGDTLCTSCATIEVFVPEAKSVVNAATDIDINAETITIVDHKFGAIGDTVALKYSTTGTSISLNSGLMIQDKAYAFNIIDKDTIQIINEGFNGTGSNIHTFTPVETSKRVEFVKTGDTPTYSDATNLCSGSGNIVSGDFNYAITTNTIFKFGIDGIKEAGNDVFSSTITVKVYDNTTDALENTYVLTRTHNNTSC